MENAENRVSDVRLEKARRYCRVAKGIMRQVRTAGRISGMRAGAKVSDVVELQIPGNYNSNG